MKKDIYLLIAFLTIMLNSIKAQQTQSSLICPEAISFPVKTGCEISGLQAGDCIRLGSTIYSSTHQSLTTFNGTNWTLSNGNLLSTSSNSISNVQFLTLGSQALDNSAGFGYSAAISDRYAVVSAPFKSFAGGNTGAVYIFKKDNTGNWIQVAAIENNATNNYMAGPGSWFGRSVDISGNDIVIGSYPPYSIYDEGGAIHFFSIDPNTNAVTYNNHFFNQRPGADFGYGVKISGNYAIAPERALYTYYYSTCLQSTTDLFLRIYKKNGSTWSLHQTITVGKDINGASIDGDMIALAQTSAPCVVNIATYRLLANVWTPSVSSANIGFTPRRGSIYRCGANTSLLFTKENGGASGDVYGKHFKLNTNANTINLAHTYNDWVSINNIVPPFPVTSLTYEGNDIIGYEISGYNSGGYLKLRNNQTSGFPQTTQYAIPSHSNRSVVIDAEAGNIIYCSNPSRSPNADDYKVLIGRLF